MDRPTSLDSTPVLKSAVERLVEATLSSHFRPPLKDWQGELCPICLEQYAEGDVVKFVPCGHFTHKACILSLFCSMSPPFRCIECRAGIFSEGASSVINAELNPGSSDMYRAAGVLQGALRRLASLVVQETDLSIQHRFETLIAEVLADPMLRMTSRLLRNDNAEQIFAEFRHSVDALFQTIHERGHDALNSTSRMTESGPNATPAEDGSIRQSSALPAPEAGRYIQNTSVHISDEYTVEDHRELVNGLVHRIEEATSAQRTPVTDTDNAESSFVATDP